MARGSHQVLPWSIEDYQHSRYTDEFVRSEFTMASLGGRTGSGFVFDTNSIHRAVPEGVRGLQALLEAREVVLTVAPAPKFWIATPVVCSLGLLPDLIWRGARRMFHPEPHHIVQEWERRDKRLRTSGVETGGGGAGGDARGRGRESRRETREGAGERRGTG